MNILSIDTTTKVARVAIKKEINNENIIRNKIENTNTNNDNKNNSDTSFEIIERELSNEITHSEKLLPLIDEALNETNLKLSDISMLACINGPGSFTGIRIGIATLKAFAQVKNLEIYTLSTLEAIAYKAYMENVFFESSKTAYISTLVDAKNDRVYFATYKISKDLNNKILIEEILNMSNEIIDLALTTITEKINTISNNDNNNDFEILFAGDCIDKFKEKIVNTNLNINNFLDIYPTPTDVINSMDYISNISKYMHTAYTLDALYARLSQAERIQNGK